MTDGTLPGQTELSQALSEWLRTRHPDTARARQRAAERALELLLQKGEKMEKTKKTQRGVFQKRTDTP